MDFEHHLEKTDGRVFLEIEFRSPFIKNLGREIRKLGDRKIIEIRGVEYRIDTENFKQATLMERTSTTLGEKITKNEWRTVATMYDFAYFVNDVFGGTPMWLKAFV